MVYLAVALIIISIRVSDLFFHFVPITPLFQFFLVFHSIFINPFLADVFILYLLKTPGSQKVSCKIFLLFSGGMKWEHPPEIGWATEKH